MQLLNLAATVEAFYTRVPAFSSQGFKQVFYDEKKRNLGTQNDCFEPELPFILLS